MMDATSGRSGNAFLTRPSRGTHQSSVLSEMSSQFHDECSAEPGRFFIDRCAESASTRRNFVFGPRTLTTGWSPIVFVTTPPQPASNARTMFDSDSVGGADDSRNGFLNRTPVNVVDKSGAMVSPHSDRPKGRSLRTASVFPRMYHIRVRVPACCRVRSCRVRRGRPLGRPSSDCRLDQPERLIG